GADALADAAARARAEADLAWLRREFPTLDADAEFPTGDPVDALIRASEDADLIAIGKRGIGQVAALTAPPGRASSAVLAGARAVPPRAPEPRCPLGRTLARPAAALSPRPASGLAPFGPPLHPTRAPCGAITRAEARAVGPGPERTTRRACPPG